MNRQRGTQSTTLNLNGLFDYSRDSSQTCCWKECVGWQYNTINVAWAGYSLLLLLVVVVVCDAMVISEATSAKRREEEGRIRAGRQGRRRRSREGAFEPEMEGRDPVVKWEVPLSKRPEPRRVDGV